MLICQEVFLRLPVLNSTLEASHSDKDIVMGNRSMCLKSDRNVVVCNIESINEPAPAGGLQGESETIHYPLLEYKAADVFVTCPLDNPMAACLQMLVLSGMGGVHKSFECSWYEAVTAKLNISGVSDSDPDFQIPPSVSATLSVTIAPHHEAAIKASKFLQLIAYRHPLVFIRLLPCLLRELKVAVRRSESAVTSQPITGQSQRISFSASRPAAAGAISVNAHHAQKHANAMHPISAKATSYNSANITGSSWNAVTAADVTTVKLSIFSPITVATMNEPLWLTAALCLSYMPRGLWTYVTTNCGLHDCLNLIWLVFYRRQVRYSTEKSFSR
jgi:hypothetical protein